MKGLAGFGRYLRLGVAVVVVLLMVVLPAAANTTPQTLPFTQDWTNTGLITAANDWSAVPGIIGYRGDAMVGSTAVDPQTVLAEGSATPVNVLANQTNPNTLTTGGIAEFDTLPNPVVALQGSGTARVPHLVLTLNTTGLSAINVAYNLRDIDGSTDNAVQPVALQFRVGGTGNYTNVSAGFVADATTGPSLATLVTPVSAPLPAAASNQPLVEVRLLTTDAVGSDEWVGIDDISVTASTDQPPAVQSTTPTNGATDVAVDANVSLTFTEPVSLSGSGFSIVCASSGVHAATLNGGPSTFFLDPTTDFAPGESCTVTVSKSGVTDQDADDPPDTMDADYVFSFTTAAAGPTPGSVVVSEVYGGGGNLNATLTNDFIELYNRTGAAISLAGWSVQYASAAGVTWQVTPLTGSIPAGKNYLVQEAAGAGGTQPLPTPDATGSIPMSATAGKVALVSTTTALSVGCPTGATIIDFVGFGTTASCFEGAGPAPAPSNTTSDLRAGGGATDNNNNATDFTAGTPDPHPSGDQAPTVASTTPANGATGAALDANVSVTFSEPVNAAGSWFSILCASSGTHAATSNGGPLTFTLDPTADFAPNELCTVTVLAANVTDQDTEDPPDAMAANYVFSFTTADILVCGASATKIHDVQGNGLATPIAGQGVTVEGVVVGDYQSTTSEFGGFYVQEEDADRDADPNTSEGIFVFDNNFGVAVNPGDVVRVRGTATEFNGLTEINAVSGVAVCATGSSVTPTAVSLPVANIDDHERTEGMLVAYNQTLTATEVFNLGRFGEVSLSGVGRLYTGTAAAAPGAPANAVTAQNNRSRIVLDDGNNQQNIDPTRYPQGGLSALNTLRVGDTLPGLIGVMDFRFSDYRIQPVGPISFSHVNARTPAPAPVGGNLKVASFNVLNFFNGDGVGGGFPTARGANTAFELGRQKAKEVSALSAMNADVVGLMEIENDQGPNSALAELVAGLNSAMGAGTYAMIDTGVIGTDEIKVALIYKPAKVTPVGTWKIITTATDPRFIDTKNRPSLAQTFELNSTGARLTVVVNHLKSKGSDCNDVGDPDTGDGSGNCNLTRLHASQALVDWLATDPTGSGDPDYLLIGDFNSYTFEQPIEWFVGHGYTNLVRQFNGLGAYSYVFDGESGYLDQGIASSSLAAQATGAADWHINPDEPTVLDYNAEFKTANQVNTFYDSGPYRSSDHDPVLVGLQLTDAAPSVSAGGPYSVNEGSTISLGATGSDPEGRTLSYAWDLDNNGSFETPGQTATFDASAIDGPNSRIVNVKATDPGGSSAFSSATVSIVNVPPQATFNAPSSVAAGFPFTLSLTAPTDPAPADTFVYAFDCGSGYGAFSASSTATCSTSTPGPLTVHGTIRDDDGDETEYNATVVVTNGFASLCALTQALVTKPDVAQGLCDKLTAAADAAARGNTKAKENILNAYRNQVHAQTGKSITAADAALLESLSLLL